MRTALIRYVRGWWMHASYEALGVSIPRLRITNVRFGLAINRLFLLAELRRRCELKANASWVVRG